MMVRNYNSQINVPKKTEGFLILKSEIKCNIFTDFLLNGALSLGALDGSGDW